MLGPHDRPRIPYAPDGQGNPDPFTIHLLQDRLHDLARSLPLELMVMAEVGTVRLHEEQEPQPFLLIQLHPVVSLGEKGVER